MPRSKIKPPYIHRSLLKKTKVLLDKHNEVEKCPPIFTYCRSSQIVKELVGFVFMVHNGKEFNKVKISLSMVGHKLGEFSPTRKIPKHKIKVIRSFSKK